MATVNGVLRTARITRGAPLINHLLFADDCLIFGEATISNASQLKVLLDCYGDCSGQLINYEKSSIFFSSNVLDFNRVDVCRILGVPEVANPEKYLGLPAIVGRNKKVAFRYLRERFQDRTLSWSTRLGIHLFLAGIFPNLASLLRLHLHCRRSGLQKCLPIEIAPLRFLGF
ncbi:hypothetical protein V6N13_111032 [Hibiscus sabdariffa]